MFLTSVKHVGHSRVSGAHGWAENSHDRGVRMDLTDVGHGCNSGTWPGQWDMDRGTSLTWDMDRGTSMTWGMATTVGHGQEQWDMDRGTSITWDMATRMEHGQDSGTWTEGPQ